MDNPFEDLDQKLDLITEKLDLMKEQTVSQINRKEVLTLKEAVEYTGLKDSTIMRHKRDGSLLSFKQAGRLYFRLKDIVSWLTKNQIDRTTREQNKKLTLAAREKRRQNMYKNLEK